MILLYIVLSIISIYVVFITYMKIKFPFWSKQPVFHFHKLHYFFKNDTYIFTDVSQMSAYKYLDLANIKIIPFKTEDCYKNNKFLIDSYFSLIRSNYLKDKKCVFNPTNDYLKQSLICNGSSSSYISLYTKSIPLYNIVQNNHNRQNSQNITLKQNVISGLTSKVIELNRNNNTTLYIHYVDFLCTHVDYRKQQFTPKVIYTYAYEIMRNQNNNIQGNKSRNIIKDNDTITIKNTQDNSIVFMFKREAENQSFVPYTVYSNFVFDLTFFNSKYSKMKANKKYVMPSCEIKLDYINSSTTEILIRAFETIKENTPHFLHILLSNVKNYIQSGIFHIFIAHQNSIPCAIYVFKNNCFSCNNQPVFECSSSIYFSSSLFDEVTFVNLFYESIQTLIDKQSIGYLNIENLSMNNILIKNMRSVGGEMYKYKNNFYLYNYILNSTQSNDIFMMI